MFPNENVRISKKGKNLLDDKELASKVSMAIAANPEKLNTKEGLHVAGLIIKSSENKTYDTTRKSKNLG